MSELVKKCEKMEVARQDELLLGAKRRLEFDQTISSSKKRVLRRSRYVKQHGFDLREEGISIWFWENLTNLGAPI